MRTLPWDEWKVHVKCWGMIFFILCSVELPEQRTPWSVGKVPYKRGGQVGTSSIPI
jgi:hypothetical protein